MFKNNNLMTTATTTDNIPRSPSQIMSVHDSGPDENTSDLSPLIPKSQQQQHQTGTSLRYNPNAAQIARIAARTRTQKQKRQKYEF